MKDPKALEAALDQFFGSENWYKHWFNRKMLYTDGVQFFAEHAGNGTYWFLDIVATEIMQIAQKGEPFINIRLNSALGRAKIVADDGNGKFLFEREIEYTDCPEGEWKFYLEEGFVAEPCFVLMLPGER